MTPRSLASKSWPPVNSPVVVADLDGRERQSRVEDHDRVGMAIAAPRGPGDVEPPLPGDAYDLRWPGPRGLMVLTVAVREVVPGVVPLWWVDAAGLVQVYQRREFVRASAAGGWPARVRLTCLLPEEVTVEGDLLDLSEGGLRASVAQWPGAEGTPVMVLLTLARVPEAGVREDLAVDVEEFEMTGTALRATEPLGAGVPGSGVPAGSRVVVVRFHEPVPRADDLRQLVFRWERAARRRASGSADHR